MARFISHFVIHHSATHAGSVQQFREMHMAPPRNYADIGYHALIGNGKGTPDGHISTGRPEDKDGAGVYGNNKAKLHVVLVGNFERGHNGFTGIPTRRQYAALGHWLLVKGKQYRRKDGTYPKIAGHKEIAIKGHGTACPGNEFALNKVRLWFDTNIDKYVQGQPVKPLDEFLGFQD